MRKVSAILGLVLMSSTVFAQVTDVAGESRSTTFRNLPGVVVEISGSSARQLMLKLDVQQNLKPNGQIEKKGKNVVCLVVDLKTKCIIRFNDDGSAAEYQQ